MVDFVDTFSVLVKYIQMTALSRYDVEGVTLALGLLLLFLSGAIFFII